MANINGKLKGKIIEKYNTIGAFARAMGKTRDTIGAKLRRKSPWKEPEIEKACALLSIDREDIPGYFFNQNV